MKCARGSCKSETATLVDLASVVNAFLCEDCTRAFVDDDRISDLLHTWQVENRRLEVMVSAFSGPAAALDRAVAQVDESARARLALRTAVRDWLRARPRPLPS